MNNLLYYFLIVVIVNITIKLLIRFYSKYSTKAYLFDFYIERLVLLNGKTVDYILFKNIKPALNSDKLIIIILNVIIQYLSNFYAKDTKLSIVFFDFNPKTGLYRSISDGCIFELQHLSVNDLYNKIKWVKGINSSNNNIFVVIKAL
jgi:hypothetical protein